MFNLPGGVARNGLSASDERSTPSASNTDFFTEESRMNRTKRITAGVAASVVLGFATLAQAQSMRPGMMHGMGHGMQGHMAGPIGMLTHRDEGSAADMGLVHELLASNREITRTVTRLPDGIQTRTESDNPQVAQAIKAHVDSMSSRLKEGREFNIFSKTLPVLFENRDKIHSIVELTDKGAVVTRTSSDPKVVAALYGHADEVTELVQDGMVAMRRGMMRRMAGGGAP
jgi:hypothetical protein